MWRIWFSLISKHLKVFRLVLDNYDLRILSADKRTDLLPIYSFNAHSLFLTNASAGLGKSLPTDKVKNSKWTKLLSTLKGAAK